MLPASDTGMADNRDKHTEREPEGLAADNRGREAEIASEEGWGTDEEKRREQPKQRPAHYGGKGYDYGAQDFGDTPSKRDNPEGVDDTPEERKAS